MFWTVLDGNVRNVKTPKAISGNQALATQISIHIIWFAVLALFTLRRNFRPDKKVRK